MDNLMVCIGPNGKLEPIPRYPSRIDAQTVNAPIYSPDKPCPKHPTSGFYRANDRCVTCTNTTPRAG